MGQVATAAGALGLFAMMMGVTHAEERCRSFVSQVCREPQSSNSAGSLGALLSSGGSRATAASASAVNPAASRSEIASPSSAPAVAPSQVGVASVQAPSAPASVSPAPSAALAQPRSISAAPAPVVSQPQTAFRAVAPVSAFAAPSSPAAVSKAVANKVGGSPKIVPASGGALSQAAKAPRFIPSPADQNR